MRYRVGDEVPEWVVKRLREICLGISALNDVNCSYYWIHWMDGRKRDWNDGGFCHLPESPAYEDADYVIDLSRSWPVWARVKKRKQA